MSTPTPQIQIPVCQLMFRGSLDNKVAGKPMIYVASKRNCMGSSCRACTKKRGTMQIDGLHHQGGVDTQHRRELVKGITEQRTKAAPKPEGIINLGGVAHELLPHLCHTAGPMLLHGP